MIGIFLVAVLLTGNLYVPLMKWRQQRVRHEMLERMEKELACTITLQPDELKWITPGKELLVAGELFDVKSRRDNPDGSVTLTGLFDEKEKQLLSHLQKKQSGGDQQKISGFFQLVLALPANMTIPPAPFYLHPSDKGTMPENLWHTYRETPCLPPWS